MRPIGYVLADALTMALYWRAPPFRRWVHRQLNRPAGFNPEVDAQRELSIRLKVARGQGFIPRPDALFLLRRLDAARSTDSTDH